MLFRIKNYPLPTVILKMTVTRNRFEALANLPGHGSESYSDTVRRAAAPQPDQRAVPQQPSPAGYRTRSASQAPALPAAAPTKAPKRPAARDPALRQQAQAKKAVRDGALAVRPPVPPSEPQTEPATAKGAASGTQAQAPAPVPTVNEAVGPDPVQVPTGIPATTSPAATSAPGETAATYHGAAAAGGGESDIARQTQGEFYASLSPLRSLRRELRVTARERLFWFPPFRPPKNCIPRSAVRSACGRSGPYEPRATHTLAPYARSHIKP